MKDIQDIQRSGKSWQGAGEEQSVEASGQIVLKCTLCGEHLTLLGLVEDWPKEHRDAFGCSACGNTVTLAHRIDGTAHTIRTLLRSIIRPLRSGV